jgi:hypothetical protein
MRMMIRRMFPVLGLLLSLPALAGAAPQQADARVTTLSMTLYLAGGRKPMADVPVTVYYQPFNPPVRFTPPVMARAMTSKAGQFTVTLDTAMVPRTGLADVGTGPDAFNSRVIAVAPSRQIVDSGQVLQVGHATTATASAITNPDTSKPELAAKQPVPPGLSPDSASEMQIGTSFRWIPVLALNDAGGMRADFDYSYDSSTAKQTEAGLAVSVEGPMSTSFGPFGFGGTSTESTDRSLTRNVYVHGDYHKIIWVRYRWVENQTIGCLKRGCTTTDTWSLDHWQGSIGQFDPDLKCVERARKNRQKCLRKVRVGVVAYKAPAFRRSNCGDDFCLTTLSEREPDFMRQTVNTQMYDFQLNVAGFLGLDSQGAYGTITSVTWNWTKHGCSGGGRKRVLWGYRSDPDDTPILQASCMKPPAQN